jgi:MYXO-CTERM domain-containing protein
MVWIGQNDQPYDRNTYAPRLNLLIDRIASAVPDAEIVLIGSYDSNSWRVRGLVDAMYDVAAARGVGFINLYDTAGNYSFFMGHGYLDDAVHFSNAGGAYMGRFLFDAFVTDGASLVPEPSGLTALAALGLLRRRRR